jgi:hypothetical protein
MAGNKIKFDEEAISEILVADSDSESGSETSDFKDYLEEEEEEEGQQQQHLQQASAEIKTQAAISGELPTWGQPQGRNTSMHPFVSPEKGVKKSEVPHSLLLRVEVFHKNFPSAG